MTPENPVVGYTALRRPAVESPNYSPGQTGWSINQDGSAEFNDLLLLGSLTIETSDGGVFIYGYQPG